MELIYGYAGDKRSRHKEAERQEDTEKYARVANKAKVEELRRKLKAEISGNDN